MTYQHDAMGRVTTEIDAEDHIKRFSYDARGNVTRVEDGNGGVGLFFYQSDDKLAYKVDPERYATHFEYNAFGELTQETRFATPLPVDYRDPSVTPPSSEDGVISLPLAQLSEYTSIEVLDGLVGVPWFGIHGAQRTSTEYDRMGQVVQTTQHSVFGDVIERYTYDAFGNQLTHTNGNGHTFTYEYDALNRNIRELSPEVNMVTGVNGESETITPQQPGDGIRF